MICYTHSMRWFVVCFFIILFSFLIVVSPVLAEDGFAACDLCGYCPPNNPPSSWDACRRCIYPNASNNPSSKQTLRLGSRHQPHCITGLGQARMKGCAQSTTGSHNQKVCHMLTSSVPPTAVPQPTSHRGCCR